MLGWIAEQVGGLTKDLVEFSEETINEVSSMSDRFSQGYESGLITNTQPDTDKETDTTTDTDK